MSLTWLCKRYTPSILSQSNFLLSIRGDTFIIISRARGWWVVQRDPAGAGIVDSDPSKQGWVPAGCLLETKIPVAKAIEQANAIHGPGSGSPLSSPVGPARMPILPLHIISTSFPGYALMDYKKKGDEELDLAKDDTLRVFKRYNHWSYVCLVIYSYDKADFC
jgi:protein STE50